MSRSTAQQMLGRPGRHATRTALSVCIDARNLPGTVVSGTGVYAIELVKHLPRSLELSVLVGSPDLRGLFESLGVRVIASLEELTECRILHRPSQIFHPDNLELFSRTRAHPIITFLDLIAYRTPTLFPKYEAYQRYCALSFASLLSAQAVLTISEHTRREIIDEFRLPPERVHTTNLGVDGPLFATPDPQRNLQLRRKGYLDHPYFLYVGSDYRHKNLLLLLRGYALLRSIWSGPGPVPGLLLVGEHSTSGGIFELGAAPAPGVRYLGAVDRNDLIALYQAALALVYPSSYEGFGLPILEAMASGTPVLCSSLTSIPEVAGEAALYLNELSLDELANKMLMLATDARLRKKLIAAGHKRAHAFRWEETARKTAEIYAAVAVHPAPEAILRKRAFAALTTISNPF